MTTALLEPPVRDLPAPVDDGSRRDFLAAAIAAGLLAGCGDDRPGPTDRDGTVRVTDQFGDVTVPRPAERVVALTMADADVLLALGATPVLLEAPTWIPGRYNPWFEDALDAEPPEGFAGAEGLPIEQIAGARPDLIVGINAFGITDTYEQLSRIAPTLGWDEAERQLPWQQHTRLVGRALGREREADALVRDTEATVADFATEHPAVRGKSILLAIGAAEGKLGLGLGDTPYNDLFERMGMVVPDGLPPAAARNGLSFERLGDLDELDVMILQPTDRAEYDAFVDLDIARSLPVVRKDGIVALLDPVDAGSTLVGIRKPTPLSIPWALDRLGDRIERAARNAES